MSIQNINLITYFDRLPTEIIFMIFNYLSSNDIIYAFFHLSQRLDYLLLENKRYLNSLELPTTNFDFWKDVLLIITSQVKCLNIKTIDLLFPLKYFTNLKSLIISSPYGFEDDQLKIILGSDQFQKLNSFKVKQNIIQDWKIFGDKLIIEKHLIERVFNHKNSLETLEYPLQISSISLSVDNFEANVYLKSLTLVLKDFTDISRVIQFTPNLKYLNVQSDLPGTNERIINKIYINLKEFHFTATAQYGVTDFDVFLSYIKQFSSSLICLSLNRIDLDMRKIPFNSLKLQQFLESMIKLQQFHLYAKLPEEEINNENILLEYKNKFWFDHKWFFGRHRHYFYTLPFHFDCLHEFYDGFDGVKSSHPELLETNPRLWYNVKILSLPVTVEYDLNFIKQLKIKLPKLTFIYFYDNGCSEQNKAEDVSINKNEKEKSNVTLNNVTTVVYDIWSKENKNGWLLHVLPNLICFILVKTDLPSIDNELMDILNKKIQWLNIMEIDKFPLCLENSSAYFSNVQHIYCDISGLSLYADLFQNSFVKILSNLKKLKTLLIHCDEKFLFETDSLIRDGNKNNTSFDVNEIMKTYHMKHFNGEYCLFTKKFI